MMLLLWNRIFIVLLTYAQISGGKRSKGKIIIAGLFPMSDVPEGVIGRGVRPAVNLALNMINTNKSILKNYHLDIFANDTRCDMAVATKFFFDMVDSNNTMVMVFGDACSKVSGPIAEISKEWNVTLLSYADTDPVLSDRKKYNNFYRTVPSESDFNPARLALLRRYNWTNVGTIYQGVAKGTARYVHAHNDLLPRLEDADITVVKSAAIVNDPEPAVVALKNSDARIIIGNFDEDVARYVFCYAFKHRLFGPKYQWIILGGYSVDWWTVPGPGLPCSHDELNRTLHGYISTDILPLSSSRHKTRSGLTPQEYLEEYRLLNKGHYSKYHAYAFDGVWVIAETIERLLRQSRPVRDRGSLDSDLFRGQSIAAILNTTNFKGVTGQVQFKGGDRVGSILIEQYQAGMMRKIAEYHTVRDRLRFKGGQRMQWQGKGPPLDRKLVQIDYRRVPNSIYISICSLAGMGIVMSFGFLAVNIVFRKHRYIKMSSPNLNNIIIIGCVFVYLSVFLLGIDGAVIPIDYLSYICTSRAWVLSLGFTLAFGAMFSKTWRVHSIFTDIKLHKKVIKDYKLFFLVSALAVIDAGILVTWQVFDPLHTSVKNLTTLVVGDYDVIPVVEYCHSDKMTIFLGIIYAYKGLLLVFGCFLAWETRQVKIPALNDSKYIGMSVYNVVMMCICGAAVSFVINDQPIQSFVIISFFIIFSTTITLCLVFVPKIIELKRDPTGEERRIRAKLQKPKKQTSRDDVNDDLHRLNEELQEDNIKCRNIIAEKMRLLHGLMEQLGGENIEDQVHFAGKSPIHKKIIALRVSDSPSRLSSLSEDDTSLFSEISEGSSAWNMAANQPNSSKCHTKSTSSTCTGYTMVDNTEDPGKRKRLCVLRQSNQGNEFDGDEEEEDEEEVKAEEEEDEDEFSFGGVYCGPSDPPPSKPKPARSENGRAVTVTEVHPLVHTHPTKSYNSTDQDLFKPFAEHDNIGNSKTANETKLNNTLDVTRAALTGKRSKLRKITFSLPQSGRVFNECVISTVQQKLVNREGIQKVPPREMTSKVSGYKSDQAQVAKDVHTDLKLGMTCDVIEHI